MLSPCPHWPYLKKTFRPLWNIMTAQFITALCCHVNGYGMTECHNTVTTWTLTCRLSGDTSHKVATRLTCSYFPPFVIYLYHRRCTRTLVSTTFSCHDIRVPLHSTSRVWTLLVSPESFPLFLHFVCGLLSTLVYAVWEGCAPQSCVSALWHSLSLSDVKFRTHEKKYI